MAVVTLKGVFLNANILKKEEKEFVTIDLYQQDSPLNNKNVTVKADDIKLYKELVDNYSMGSVIELEATVNAFNNRAYYKLQRLIS